MHPFQLSMVLTKKLPNNLGMTTDVLGRHTCGSYHKSICHYRVFITLIVVGNLLHIPSMSVHIHVKKSSLYAQGVSVAGSEEEATYVDKYHTTLQTIIVNLIR